MAEFYDAFISYGRADSKEFAAKLCQQLTGLGYRVWFDLNDIPLGVDYQQQIDDDLERSHNFIFIMSPHSVNSSYCRMEVERAVARHKRIIPLLHVDEISRQTWQQRHPDGTDADWADYQTQKLHFGDVRNPRLHPILSKINWIYGREEQDDLDAALRGLADIFERHRDYVHQHTNWLIKALDWEARQRRSQFLLIGQERKQAEAWLQIRFEDEQPPCTPSNLHCEFISESTKNADNLMTQVFIAYAQEDAMVMDKIKRSLWREGITVWTSDSDIRSGENFQKAINQGIEQADNLIYLLSPASEVSDFCQHEFDYATTLHKRIIPILVRPTPLEAHSPKLRELQYIDLTDNQDEDDYWLDESQLLRILRTDQGYYRTHKVLLAKALKWERQHRNPSILLRGYNLRQANIWLKTAQKRSVHPPTNLQALLIDESLRQPPINSLDVFISYSRSDSEFARKLNENLQIYGKLTWFDQESIAASSADFQQEICRGIETADNFLFILSPKAVKSPYCADEVNYAAQLNKRFITVLHQTVNLADLHPELAKVQWIDFSDQDDNFWESFNQIVRVLETDREHVHQHSKWSQRAIEWEDKQRSHDLLLRGNEFAIAHSWLTTSTDQQKQPPPTALQQAFIQASQEQIVVEERREKRQQRLLRSLLGAVSVALIAAVGTGLMALRQARRATHNQIDALSQASQASFTLNSNSFEALLQALAAGTQLSHTDPSRQSPDLQAKVMTVLAQANYWVRERNRLNGHSDYIQDVSFSPDGSSIATASIDTTVKLWQRDGSQIHTLKGHTDNVNSVSFSPDGDILATASNDQTARLWKVDGQLITTLTGHQGWVNSISFSPDGQTLATASDDTTIKLWTTDGEEIQELRGHQSWVSSVSFSPDGQTLATGSGDTSVKLWATSGELLHTFTGHQAAIDDLDFSPDGQTLASASFDGTVILWNIPQRIRQLTLRGHQGRVSAVDFSPNGQILATSGEDETIKLWTINGQVLATLNGHHGRVSSINFSPDSRTLASASFDKTVKLWQLDLPRLNPISHNHQAAIYGLDISPDGKIMVTASGDHTVKFWDSNGQLLQTLLAHQDSVNRVSFSPDGQTVGTASSDQTAKLWSRSGQEKHVLSGHHDEVSSISFSPDGQLIGTASFDGTAKLWQQDGTLIRTLEGNHGPIQDISFSPESQLVATANDDGTAQIWTTRGEVLTSLEGHKGAIYRVKFSPKGNIVATTSEDNTAKLWTVDGEELLTLDAHIAGIWDLAFNPNGEMIATASDDNTIKLWQLDGRLIATLTGHQAPVSGLRFSEDGNTLVSVGSGPQLLIWDVTDFTMHGLLTYGCSWLSDYIKTNPTASKQLCEGIDSIPIP